MRYKLTFVAGFATGYVLGTKAGRKRYDLITDGLRRLIDSPAVQETAGVLQAQASGAFASASSTVTAKVSEKVSAHRLAAAVRRPRPTTVSNSSARPAADPTARRPTRRPATRSSAASPVTCAVCAPRSAGVVRCHDHRIPDPVDPYEDAGLPATDDALPGKLITGDVQDDVVVPTDHADLRQLVRHHRPRGRARRAAGHAAVARRSRTCLDQLDEPWTRRERDPYRATARTGRPAGRSRTRARTATTRPTMYAEDRRHRQRRLLRRGVAPCTSSPTSTT